MYSISSTTNALKNVDIGIYLVHSMQPSTRMNHGTFEDTDILLADNFSIAANECQLKQIIYVGGILPKDSFKISKHLKSRHEVEKTLGSRSTPLTTIRAGIIIGPDGSSFRIIQKLVENLPIMACPEWTKSLNQPLDIRDALKVIEWCILNEESYNKPIEIGGNEVISYMDLLRITAKKMNKKVFTKSGIMVGLGETRDEILQVMDDLKSADVDFLTIGQYLQPSVKHFPLDRYYKPEEFEELGDIAKQKVFY